MHVQAAPVMLGALCVIAIAYRYYSAFIAARVLALDAAAVTPAHRLADGHNYVPTNRWVLFGHHFAAISGSGPLIGPTLAAQFGFAPGFLWLLVGVVLAGAVHDFVILTASIRSNGRSLAEIVRHELGPVPGMVAMVAILTIVIIAIAGLGIVVVNALAESAWGTFTVGASIPIALAMGLWAYRFRKGKIRESTIGGVVLLLAALVFGKYVQDSSLGALFRYDKTTITLAIAAYGFVASVLPVWLLLCPRDYLSSYLKIGTIALLVLGVILVNPRIEMPMFTRWVHGGGPIVKGPLFPFVFVTIACGAISGFHALVSTGTTPKMIDNERDARTIGYGAMLVEGIVGLTALIAATSLPVADYYAINTDPAVRLVASAQARTPDGRPRGARRHRTLAFARGYPHVRRRPHALRSGASRIAPGRTHGRRARTHGETLRPPGAVQRRPGRGRLPRGRRGRRTHFALERGLRPPRRCRDRASRARGQHALAHRSSHGRRRVPRRGHGSRLRRAAVPPGPWKPVCILVSFCNHVRSAFHTYNH